MSLIIKGVDTESDITWRYFPGRKRKKKDIQASSEMFCFIGVPPWLLPSIQCRIVIGGGWN